MSVKDLILNRKKTAFSFEILPPLKGNGIESVYSTIDLLREFDPQYINITTHRSQISYKTQENGLFQCVVERQRPGTVAIAAALFAGYSAYNTQNNNELTDIALANVEALAASDEGTTPTETWQVGKKTITKTIHYTKEDGWEWSVKSNVWLFEGEVSEAEPDSTWTETTTTSFDCCRKLGNLKSCSYEEC